MRSSSASSFNLHSCFYFWIGSGSFSLTRSLARWLARSFCFNSATANAWTYGRTDGRTDRQTDVYVPIRLIMEQSEVFGVILPDLFTCHSFTFFSILAVDKSNDFQLYL